MECQPVIHVGSITDHPRVIRKFIHEQSAILFVVPDLCIDTAQPTFEDACLSCLDVEASQVWLEPEGGLEIHGVVACPGARGGLGMGTRDLDRQGKDGVRAHPLAGASTPLL